MNKQEAQTAIKHGHKITHVTFMPEEYIYSSDKGYTITTDDGYSINSHTFWKDRTSEIYEEGYSIVSIGVPA